MREQFEKKSLWKMLVLLGWSAPGEVEAGLVRSPLSEAVLHVSDALRAQLVAQATEAIVESHLCRCIIVRAIVAILEQHGRQRRPH